MLTLEGVRSGHEIPLRERRLVDLPILVKQAAAIQKTGFFWMEDEVNVLYCNTSYTSNEFARVPVTRTRVDMFEEGLAGEFSEYILPWRMAEKYHSLCKSEETADGLRCTCECYWRGAECAHVILHRALLAGERLSERMQRHQPAAEPSGGRNRSLHLLSPTIRSAPSDTAEYTNVRRGRQRRGRKKSPCRSSRVASQPDTETGATSHSARSQHPTTAVGTASSSGSGRRPAATAAGSKGVSSCAGTGGNPSATSSSHIQATDPSVCAPLTEPSPCVTHRGLIVPRVADANVRRPENGTRRDRGVGAVSRRPRIAVGPSDAVVNVPEDESEPGDTSPKVAFADKPCTRMLDGDDMIMYINLLNAYAAVNDINIRCLLPHTFSNWCLHNTFSRTWEDAMQVTETVFTLDMLLVPLHTGLHWALGVVNFRELQMCVLDSVEGYCIPRTFKWNMLLWLVEAWKMESTDEFPNGDKWETVTLVKVPQQRGGQDCGMYACLFAK
eukprot:GHVU01005087.1.p1 GENE.GHVU01005087.1~~GHVU01005087.1.p1  ORF type:complete len:499 (-),score=24.87 GHVU01005087.1:305-1801(-)